MTAERKMGSKTYSEKVKKALADSESFVRVGQQANQAMATKLNVKIGSGGVVNSSGRAAQYISGTVKPLKAENS